MKNFLTLTALGLLSFNAFASIKVIYGKDNRLDFYQVNSHLHRKLALSTAGMIHLKYFARSSSQNFYDLQGTTTLERGQNICSSEAFSQQQIAPTCSGFLVGEDTLITAGHCYKSFSTPENVCKSFAWVFDYHLKSAQHNPTRNIPVQNIYLCKKVLAVELTKSMDYAVIKLDRKVLGRRPLKFRTSGKISSSSSLLVIGHPTGLPQKISSGGRVTRNSEATTFSATLDTFQGNSGSAVFDARTGLVEGILIQGKNDYIPSQKNNPNSCLVVNKCDEFGNNCESGKDSGPIQWGEVILRITSLTKEIESANNIKM